MINIIFLKEENRAIAYDDNIQIGECIFEEIDNVWNIIHTRVDNKYRGQGIARKLLDNVIENAKTYNKNLDATCSYAKKVLIDSGEM